MSDETSAPVPPGWVRLTSNRGEILLPLRSISGLKQSLEGPNPTCVYTTNSDSWWNVAESPAEVAALIDAAQRAQRRAEALPVMAAIILGATVAADFNGKCVFANMAHAGEELLDAIEAREAGR